MPIASLVVRAADGKEPDVVSAINQLEGADAQPVEAGSGNIVVITETSGSKQDGELWDLISAIPGVVSVNLAYHNVEDLVEGDA